MKINDLRMKKSLFLGSALSLLCTSLLVGAGCRSTGTSIEPTVQPKPIEKPTTIPPTGSIDVVPSTSAAKRPLLTIETATQKFGETTEPLGFRYDLKQIEWRNYEGINVAFSYPYSDQWGNAEYGVEPLETPAGFVVFGPLLPGNELIQGWRRVFSVSKTGPKSLESLLNEPSPGTSCEGIPQKYENVIVDGRQIARLESTTCETGTLSYVIPGKTNNWEVSSISIEGDADEILKKIVASLKIK